jgi:hypothetical protein
MTDEHMGIDETGDWFIGEIKDLQPSPTLGWFRHCFAPAAVFVDLTDQRYTKHTTPFQPGLSLSFNLVFPPSAVTFSAFCFTGVQRADQRCQDHLFTELTRLLARSPDSTFGGMASVIRSGSWEFTSGFAGPELISA